MWEAFTCGGDIYMWEAFTCETSHQSEILHSLIFCNLVAVVPIPKGDANLLFDQVFFPRELHENEEMLVWWGSLVPP